MIATRRRNQRLARLEAGVLVALGRHGAPVPRVLAFDGVWLFQEDAGQRSLSQALARCDAAEGEVLLDRALAALADCRRAASGAGLDGRMPPIAAAQVLLQGPSHVAAALGSAPPELTEALKECFAETPRVSFVKSDTRPANALVGADGRIVWIDWEHACRGHPVNDITWLLGDEWVPDWPDSEQRLIAAHRGPAAGVREDYLWLYGALNALMRLGAILKMKGDGPWWDAETCLAHDLLGVTPVTAMRLCRRARRWAARSPQGGPLSAWIESLEPRLVSL